MALSLPARAAQTLWFFVQLLTFPVLQYSSSAPPAAALGFFFSAPMPTCVPSFARRLSSCLRLCAPARSGGSVSRRGSFSLSHTLSQPAKTFPCFAGRSRSTASLTTRMASPESGASPPSASADAAQAAPREVDVKRDVVPFPGAKTEEQWKGLLTPEQFRVLRMKGTEAPHTGYYNRFFPKTGFFACAACSHPLYPAKAKFGSGCGWPAFDRFFKGSVISKNDFAFGMKRTEILCANCGSHLGHVFEGEGFTESNERHCVNSVSVKYVEEDRPVSPTHIVTFESERANALPRN